MSKSYIQNVFIRIKNMLYYCRLQYNDHARLDDQDFAAYTRTFFWPAFMIAMRSGTANDLISNTRAEEMQRLLNNYEDICNGNSNAKSST